jgi:hypothetical protein
MSPQRSAFFEFLALALAVLSGVTIARSCGSDPSLGVEVTPQVAPAPDDLAIATHMYRAMLQQCRAARCFGCCPCEANAPPMSVAVPTR